jgi:predicted DNA-binding protein (MmcQ/YjbR family)
MTEKEFLNYCLNKKGAYLDFPFGDGVAVVKVGNENFRTAFRTARRNYGYAQLHFRRGTALQKRLSLKRGYHCPPVQQPYFNSCRLISFPTK